MTNIRLTVQNNQSGATWEIGELVTSVEYETTRGGSAGRLTFSYVKDSIIDLPEGSVVRLDVDSKTRFLGYVFVKKQNRWGEVNITAYDQLIYLKANQSFVFQGAKVENIIRNIASYFDLKIGELADTGYMIPLLNCEDKQCLDIIYQALSITKYNTGKIFNFYDDAGYLRLTESSNMIIPVILGSQSLMTDFEYTTDIESDTYNQVKLVQPNPETGHGDVYIAMDSNNIRKWGLLQLYKKVDEKLNPAQIQAQLEQMGYYYNRVSKTFSFEALGIPELRAGNMVYLNIPQIPDLYEVARGVATKTPLMIIDSVKHVYEGQSHTMSVEMRIPAPPPDPSSLTVLYSSI